MINLAVLSAETTRTDIFTPIAESTSTKESLIEDNAWRARLLASRMHLKFPRLDLDDLRSIALLALVESARTWDPKCASFSTWSGRRIEWALIDYIRVQRGRGIIRQRPVVSIDELSPADALHLTDEAPNPESEAITRILAGRLGKAMEQLPSPAPDILKLFYVEGWTQQRIGAALELSESRVSKIRAGAVARLKNRFSKRPERVPKRTVTVN